MYCDKKTIAMSLFLFCIAIPAAAQGWSQPLPTGTLAGLNGLFSVSSTMTIAVGNSGTIIGTSDGGNTWNAGSSGTTNHLRKVFVSGLTLPVITAVGDNGTILRSTNAGLTWLNWASGVTADLLDIFVHDPMYGSTMTIVGESGVILFTNNAGANWNLRLSPTPENLNGVFFKTLLEGFAVGNAGTIIQTFNSGWNWQPVTSPAASNLNHIFFTHPDTGWIVGDMGRILRTTDGGTTWDPMPSPTLENLRRVMFTSVSTGTAVGDNGVILRTTDGGNTWDHQNSGLGSDLTSVFFVDANNGMVTGERGIVIATMNGGVPVELSAFSAIGLNDGAVELRWQTETEEQNFGFDVERDAGAGWESMGFIAGSGDSKIAQRYSFVDRRPFDTESLLYRLRQRDYDGGWEYSPVIMFKRDVHPFSPALSAWPNPFHSSTNLQLTLPRASSVRLRIYDSEGQLCATIQEAAMEAGAHILPWQADGFASGRYIAVLEADGFRRITDLVFQK